MRMRWHSSSRKLAWHDPVAGGLRQPWGSPHGSVSARVAAFPGRHAKPWRGRTWGRRRCGVRWRCNNMVVPRRGTHSPSRNDPRGEGGLPCPWRLLHRLADARCILAARHPGHAAQLTPRRYTAADGCPRRMALGRPREYPLQLIRERGLALLPSGQRATNSGPGGDRMGGNRIVQHTLGSPWPRRALRANAAATTDHRGNPGARLWRRGRQLIPIRPEGACCSEWQHWHSWRAHRRRPLGTR